MTTRHHRPRHLPVRVVVQQGGRLALEVGGVTQSVVVPEIDGSGGVPERPASESLGGYWAAMLPQNCPRQALVLGLGGGTVARWLERRCPGVRIVGVERDETVLAVARAELGLDEIAGLEIVRADAFEWVPDAALREPGAYDYICVDLFEAGRAAMGSLATPFLRQVAALLAPEGIAAINLMITRRTSDQLRRLERVFDLVRLVRVRGNLVVHARPHARVAGEPDACAEES
jgi:spermidine synthase